MNSSYKADNFIFSDYVFDKETKTAHFSYSVEFEGPRSSEDFQEELVFTKDFDMSAVNKDILDTVLRNVHLVLGLSYFKMYFPRTITTPYSLSKDEAEFWNTLYQKGLGEYMYANQLSYSDMAEFEPSDQSSHVPIVSSLSDRVLAGIGGGKDSIVAVELFKKSGVDVAGFVVETGATSEIERNVMSVAGIDGYVVQRVLDRKVFEIEDVYNGHIPVSSIFAFIGLLSCVLYNYRYISLSNAQTSNFGNLVYDDREINHAWSKSQEFEILFNEHVHKTITSGIGYFSIIRPFFEIRIIEMFVDMPQYFDIFTSCNHSFKVHKEKSQILWCGECDKCAYMFIMLAAFLPRSVVLDIFEKNLLDDPSLLQTYRNILGLGSHKPFDCVGEFGEVRIAFDKIKETYADTCIVRDLEPDTSLHQDDESIFLRTYISNTIPALYKFIGMKTCGILGYGTSGTSSYNYMKEKFPDIKLSILDRESDPEYLEKSRDFDILIKTPGIQKRLVNTQYTTAMNIFFAEMEQRDISVVGVTGTAGKSTTVSLIQHILVDNNLDAYALGNIGNPVLESLPAMNSTSIPIVELSSYQLDDLYYSPHIAVILNIMPDHLDYHGSHEAYSKAKSRIALFQDSNDYFLYNQNIEVSDFSANAKRVPLQLMTKSIQNIPDENVAAAYQVAVLCGVKVSDIQRSIRTFKSLPHRMQNLGQFQGIFFYDDARSSTPESTIIAIRSIENIETILVGGLDRGYDFSALHEEIMKSSIKNIVAFPDSGEEIIRGLLGYNILKTDSMREAVEFAYGNTQSGQACLLSTASPSYSLWKNFEEKGRQYQSYVHGHESEN